MTPQKGPITEQKESQEVNYGTLNIGDAWTQKEQSQDHSTLSPFKTARRMIFPIPSENKAAFIEFLSSAVNQSKEMICLSSYMIQQSPLTDALLAAASRGIRVYILTSGEEELERVDTEMDDVEKAKIEEYKHLLNRMAGQVLIRTAPHFHAKFLLVDPKAENGRGVMMTCNATVDAMTGRNLEVAVSLTKTENASFFSQFIRAFWIEAKHELLRAGELNDVLQPPKSISFKQVTHPATLSGCTTLRERVKELIDSAEKTIIVSGWSFGTNHSILEALTKAAERGVAVKVFARVAFGNTEALAALVAKGANVQGHDRYHAKMVIADSSKALLMTSNFTERGLDTGFETGIELEGDEISALITIASQWESICEWKLCRNLQLRYATRQIRKKNAVTKKIEFVEVNDSTTKELAPHTLLSLDAARYQPSFDSANPNALTTGKLFKQVLYTWRISPPILPSRAYPVPQAKERLPLFRMPSGESFVTVRNWEDVEIAKPIAAKWKARIVLPLPNNYRR